MHEKVGLYRVSTQSAIKFFILYKTVVLKTIFKQLRPQNPTLKMCNKVYKMFYISNVKNRVLKICFWVQEKSIDRLGDKCS